jgi:O-acetyl-ADP-ribose deacetylase (regulator of RNase III)
VNTSPQPAITCLDLGGMAQIYFEAGDLTKKATDAIVNAANSKLAGGGGVDGAIHRAGGPAILEACKKIVARDGNLPPGEAVETTGGKLKAAFVIHTVGPVYRDGNHGESGVLANAYRNSLRLADRLGLHSLAFPAISTGVYGYPAEAAAQIAVATVIDTLLEARSVHEAWFVLFRPEMLQTFVQAAREEQQRRKADRWSFQSLPPNLTDPQTNP